MAPPIEQAVPLKPAYIEFVEHVERRAPGAEVVPAPRTETTHAAHTSWIFIEIIKQMTPCPQGLCAFPSGRTQGKAS
jgi:hypothetical protein